MLINTSDNPPKKFVVDTCVFRNDEDSIFKFGNNEVIIPSVVWEELNNVKSDKNEGYLPRKILRLLQELSTIRPLREGVKLNELPPTSMFYEKAKDQETLIKIDYRIRHNNIEEAFIMKKHDYHILSCAKNNDAILVTMDIGLLSIAPDWIKKAEEHKSEKVKTQNLYTGYKRDIVHPDLITELYSKKMIEDRWNLYPNQFIILEDEENSEHLGIGIKKKDFVKVCNFDKELNFSMMKTRPINLEQKMLLYLLQDPEILCISVTGISGRGKTLICSDYALAEIKKGNYNRFAYTKSIIPVDESEYMGYYKGGLDDKLLPHLQSLFSCIEYLYKDEIYKLNGKTNGNGNGNGKCKDEEAMTPEKKFKQLREAGKLEVFPLAEIRGMNIFKKIVMLDEAQNTKKHMMKSLATRLTDESKLIVTGDVEQIDDPSLNFFNNGLAHLIENGKEEPFIAHITLDIDKKDSKRGKLATFGARKL